MHQFDARTLKTLHPTCIPKIGSQVICIFSVFHKCNSEQIFFSGFRIFWHAFNTRVLVVFFWLEIYFCYRDFNYRSRSIMIQTWSRFYVAQDSWDGNIFGWMNEEIHMKLLKLSIIYISWLWQKLSISSTKHVFFLFRETERFEQWSNVTFLSGHSNLRKKDLCLCVSLMCVFDCGQMMSENECELNNTLHIFFTSIWVCNTMRICERAMKVFRSDYYFFI